MLATAMLVAAAVGLFLVAVGLRGGRGGRRKASVAPGPRPWPLVGNLALLGGHRTPFHAFTKLAEKFGAVYRLRLGAAHCLVVNNFALIKEVLITKGGHFGGRPDFIRFHQLFGGDRDNCE
jgi:cytochrome P450 family 307 subfamily A